MDWSELALAAVVILLITAVVAFVLALGAIIFWILAAWALLGLLCLSPWILKGFLEGWREERRAENSNPTRG